MLNAQLAHSSMPGHLDPGRMRHSQGGTSLLEKADGEVDALLFCGCQTMPPIAEFIGELHLPCHNPLCHIGHYVVDSINACQTAANAGWMCHHTSDVAIFGA